ncbi:bifunctional UDP-N-acetylglucosamine diphosphorylase/glucosamine-1-phosphate N-acetyltransferase GlmU [Slackia exigua]|uniref:bifunctional UDP-N-acetylglucosamine diphosphorylase/glucosamine-1-phosphate N-acetyltransferase GlmU n=1 Tax=Slackia exigua TaxID=84109 RepID=UPI0028D6D73D|nr:bifunctional UDP-N-acetylglucosamine diphosphorylase/glucosamine-1-phosphate N-acetyltransferase GlmU [Slackia exigua]
MKARALILAAGAGTRMKSKKPKVAHEILGVPLVRWVADAAHASGIDDVVAVLGHGADQVRPLVEDQARIVIQERQLGTGDAVAVARDAFSEDGRVAEGSLVVLSGDCPLIRPETIAALVRRREETGAAVVVLTMEMPDPTGYGRIVRASGSDDVLRIVEQKDCTPGEAELTECNSGFYCFDAPALFDALGHVGSDNAQGEYYLTDVLEICREAGRAVVALPADDASEALGVNSRAQLAQATAAMRDRINAAHMAAGVTMWDPSSTYIGPRVTIEPDVELLPSVMLLGDTSVGEGSVVGPNTRLTDTVVGEGCAVDETVAVGACIDDGASCGPRAYLRPEAHVCEGAKVGTHVEIKKSTIGAGSKVPHLSYIGDATMGEGVNIGAGTITCNYDGVHKHRTVIGNGVFIGSDTMLVAPVTIGDGAVIGASSCITRDVAPDALALERAEQRQIEGWASRHMEKLKSRAKPHGTPASR